MEDLLVLALDCYRSAVRNVAFYAIELDKEVTTEYRSALAHLESRFGAAGPSDLPDLLRDYRGRALAYVSRLCGELEQTADRLAEILNSLSDGDADYDNRMRNALDRLRTFGRSADAGEIGAPLLVAALAAQEGIEEMRRRQNETVGELMSEIRSLHRKIDALESAGSLDILGALLTREEMEERLQFAPRARRMLLKASGLRLAASRFDAAVAEQVTAGFLKRLHRILPPESAIARWDEEEFLVLLPPAADSAPARNVLEEQLSGSYGCLLEGKSVRPALNVCVEEGDFSLQVSAEG